MMFFWTFYTLKNPDKKKITVSTNKIKKHNIDIYWLTDWLIDFDGSFDTEDLHFKIYSNRNTYFKSTVFLSIRSSFGEQGFF